MGGWVNGRREGVGELIFANYKYKGNFSSDQVHGRVKVHVLYTDQLHNVMQLKNIYLV